MSFGEDAAPVFRPEEPVTRLPPVALPAKLPVLAKPRRLLAVSMDRRHVIVRVSMPARKRAPAFTGRSIVRRAGLSREPPL